MTIINLRDFYYWYTQDEYMEVTDDVAEALRASVRYEAAYTERAWAISVRVGSACAPPPNTSTSRSYWLGNSRYRTGRSAVFPPTQGINGFRMTSLPFTLVYGSCRLTALHIFTSPSMKKAPFPFQKRR